MTSTETTPGELPRWLYESPDSGTEMSVDHPVRSGACPDAQNIRPATKANLVAELLIAWDGWEEARVLAEVRRYDD